VARLGRAVAHGLARRDGKGTRTDPFRYWLPDQEFPSDPLLAMLHESQRTRANGETPAEC